MVEAIRILGPVTSLLVWRAVMMGIIGEPDTQVVQPDLTQCRARVRDLRNLRVVRQLGEVPLDAIVGSPSQTHVSAGLHTIVLKGKLPAGSFCLTEEGVYLCSPELCFALLARGGSFLHLCVVGSELCGAYSIAPDQSGNFCKCPPRTSVAKLDAYLAAFGRRHGIKLARQAVSVLLDGSRSPRETSLYLMLTLPCSRGGYAIRRPVLNGQIDISEEAQKLLGKGFLTVDELWSNEEGKPILAAEYDSDEHHFFAFDNAGNRTIAFAKIISDDERREVLREREVDVVTVRTRDTEIFDRFEAKALRIGALVQTPPRPSTGRLRNVRVNLFMTLYGTRQWSVEHALLFGMAGYNRAITHQRRKSGVNKG